MRLLYYMLCALLFFGGVFLVFWAAVGIAIGAPWPAIVGFACMGVMCAVIGPVAAANP